MQQLNRWSSVMIGAMLLAGAFLLEVRPAFRVLTVVLGLGTIATAVLWSRRGRHTPWREAVEQQRPGHAIVLWKPGCAYCEVLLARLRHDPRITWVNVWQDDAANDVVRSHNQGNELTPTALVGDRVLINPSAAELRAALDR